MRLVSNLRGWLQGTAPELRQKRPAVQSAYVSEAKAPKDNALRKWLQGTHPDLRGGFSDRELERARENISAAAKRAPLDTPPVSSYKPDTLARQFARADGFDVSTSKQTSQRMAGTELPPTTKPRKQRSADERIMYGDKDARSMLAEEKLRIANDMAGGGYSRDQLVDMLNEPGVQQGEQFINALNEDARINAIINLNREGQFARPEFETQDFIGEGQFGRVSEFVPGYVVKRQAPLVEWHGYQTNDDGTNSVFGKLEGQGRIHDHRDVAAEVDQLNTLNKIGITPKVESFTVEPDGSTEMLMRDLRKNYTPGEDFYNDLRGKIQDGSEAESAEAFKQARLFDVKRKQQEAMAAAKGLHLGDRHEGNVMAHKMMNRPLQIDPSAVKVEGGWRDRSMYEATVGGMMAAGLEQEADIFQGLVMEAADRGDEAGVHDLVQQGMSRLMKIKQL